jgi:hypothetical protein
VSTAGSPISLPPFPAGYRASGLLLHVTSLPSHYGIGDVGPGALAWIDRLQEAGQTWWQALPTGPTGYGDSPYQSLSSFADNGLLPGAIHILPSPTGSGGRYSPGSFPCLRRGLARAYRSTNGANRLMAGRAGPRATGNGAAQTICFPQPISIGSETLPRLQIEGKQGQQPER